MLVLVVFAGFSHKNGRQVSSKLVALFALLWDDNGQKLHSRLMQKVPTT